MNVYLDQGRTEIMRLLLEDRRKMDPNHYHQDGFTPLHRVCWGHDQRHIDTIKLLVETGRVKHDVKARNGKTCRHIAGHPGMLDLLDQYEKQEKQEKKAKKSEL